MTTFSDVELSSFNSARGRAEGIEGEQGRKCVCVLVGAFFSGHFLPTQQCTSLMMHQGAEQIAIGNSFLLPGGETKGRITAETMNHRTTQHTGIAIGRSVRVVSLLGEVVADVIPARGETQESESGRVGLFRDVAPRRIYK